jgi:hypothetical protein
MSPKPIAKLVEEWREAAATSKVSTERGRGFNDARVIHADDLEALLREWDEYLAHVTSSSMTTTGMHHVIQQSIFGMEESK